MGFRNRVNATWVKLQNGKFYIPNPQGPDQLISKTGIVSQYDTCDIVDCYLKSIQFRDRKDSDFGPQWVFEFLTDDGKPFILAQSSMSYLPYSLMNSFASLTSFGKLELSATGVVKEKNILTNVYIKNDGEPVRWKWKIDEIVQPTVLKDSDGDPVIENGKIKKSFKKVIAHYQEHVLPGILEILSKSSIGATDADVEYVVDEFDDSPESYSQVPPEKPKAQPVTKNSKDLYPKGEDDDIPF